MFCYLFFLIFDLFKLLNLVLKKTEPFFVGTKVYTIGDDTVCKSYLQNCNTRTDLKTWKRSGICKVFLIIDMRVAVTIYALNFRQWLQTYMGSIYELN